eukprot:5672215-Pleurochrysis_carterae.AAC.1
MRYGAAMDGARGIRQPARRTTGGRIAATTGEGQSELLLAAAAAAAAVDVVMEGKEVKELYGGAGNSCLGSCDAPIDAATGQCAIAA